MIRLLAELIYPKRCIFCDRVLPWGKDCGFCMDEVDSLRNTKDMVIPVTNGAVPFLYRDSVRHAMLKLKYYERVEYKRKFAEEMVKVLPETQFDCIVSVPAYRHFHGITDTPRELAREISRITGFAYRPKYIKKVRQTLLQHELSYAQRQENLIGCFWADSLNVQGKEILLVDDIITTGATMNECSKSLLNAGAKEVFCIAACITPL